MPSTNAKRRLRLRSLALVFLALASSSVGHARGPAEGGRFIGALPGADGRSQAPDDARRATAERLQAEATALIAQASTPDFPKDAIARLEEAERLWRQLGDVRREAEAAREQGRACERAEQAECALHHHGRALTLQRNAGLRSEEQQTLWAIADVYESIGGYDSAIKFFRQALAISLALNDRAGESRSLHGIGVMQYRMFLFPEALTHCSRALEIAEQLGLPDRVASGLLRIGILQNELKNPQLALEYFRRALPLTRSLGDRLRESTALHNIGSSLAQLGNFDGAVESLAASLAIRQALRVRRAEVITRRGLSSVERARGNFGEALLHIEAAITLIEGMRSLLTSNELRTEYLSTKQITYEFYLNLLMQLHEREPSAGYQLRALEAAERARARGLLDLLGAAASEVRSGIDDESRRREQELHSRIARLSRRFSAAETAAQPDTRELAVLGDELERAQEERLRLQWTIREAHPAYADLHEPMPARVSEIQALVEPSSALLLYTIGRARSFLFVVTSEQVVALRLPAPGEIERLVRDLRAGLERPGRRQFGGYVQAATRLYQMLIAPAADLLEGKRALVIVPHASLYQVPFGALLTEDSPASGQTPFASLPYLLRRWSVSYVQSASVLASLRKLRRSSSLDSADDNERKQLVAFAHPGGSSLGVDRVPRLQHVVREVAEIGKEYAPNQVVTYTGLAATEQAVKTASALQQARRVHFATHALLNDDPQYSGLVLSGESDGLLHTYEIFNLKLRAELVILSACRTAQGKHMAGEGILGFTRAFLYAGASSVVASLWQVADASTAQLMIEFHRRLATKPGGTASALRAAKLALIEDERWAHPYYWAPFVLVGEPGGP